MADLDRSNMSYPHRCGFITAAGIILNVPFRTEIRVYRRRARTPASPWLQFRVRCPIFALPVRLWLHYHQRSGANRPAAFSITAPSENSVSSSNGRPIS